MIEPPIQPLVERPSVRRAVVALCRTLMREAGVRVSDLAPPPATAASAVEQQERADMPVSRRRSQLVTPVDKPLTKALKRAGFKPRETVPGVVAKAGLPGGEVIVPPGVKVTQCPSGRDTRYVVDGPVIGEFTLDWLRKRAGRS